MEIEVEAESLEQARQKLIAQLPQGHYLKSEQVIVEGSSGKINLYAVNEADAVFLAQKQVPHHARILAHQVLSSATTRTISVEATDAEAARAQAVKAARSGENLQQIRLVSKGSQGFMGVGRRQDLFEAILFTPAVIEITYHVPVRVRAVVVSRITETRELINSGDYRAAEVQLNQLEKESVDQAVELRLEFNKHQRLNESQATYNRLLSGKDMLAAELALVDLASAGLPAAELEKQRLRLLQKQRALLIGVLHARLQQRQQELQQARQLQWERTRIVMLLQARADRTLSPSGISEPGNPAGILWVQVPAGEFNFGEANERRWIENPFQIGKNPVTNLQYQRFLIVNPHYPAPSHWDIHQHSYPEGKAHQPVTNICWHDAQAFCQWAGCRLPTEEEWEKAARAGSIVSANVWEWTDSWYGNARIPRVLRGGLGSTEQLKRLFLINRDGDFPSSYRTDTGFRVVKYP
jgi:hypothetical protein